MMKAIGADRAFQLSEGNLFYEFDKKNQRQKIENY